MQSQTNKLEFDNQNEEVDFKELEPLLRECLGSKELQIVNYTATKLLPSGENYCSILVKLDIKFRKDEFAEEEMLHLVAKTPTTKKSPFIEWPLVFKKELFMYAELRPLYRELERDVGIQEDELIDLWPEYIGYRNSLKDNNIIDNDSLVLMKNITFDGFYTLNRKTGMDVHHARIALTTLARYHALGIAMKEKRPEFAKRAIDQASVLGMSFQLFDETFDKLRQMFNENPPLQKHLLTIESSFNRIRNGATWKAKPTEPWATITHGDFWTNNILFHKDEEGNVDDVKFVDFQTYLYSSPLKDVPYFLSGSLAETTKIECLNDLVNLYYDTFVKTLKRVNCDTTPFTRESFDLELKKQACNEFPLSVLAIKFFLHETDDTNKYTNEVINDIVNTGSNNVYIRKLEWLIDIYEKMKWFGNS